MVAPHRLWSGRIHVGDFPLTGHLPDGTEGNTAIGAAAGEPGGAYSEVRAQGTFAHEYTHQIDYISDYGLRQDFCCDVGIYISDKGELGTLPQLELGMIGNQCICTSGISNDAAGQALANVVGLYIADEATAKVLLTQEAIDFVEGRFADYLRGGCTP
jgi:hypothetical protein